MRVHRHLITVATLTMLLGAAACAPYGGRTSSGMEVSARWDSGPLDRDYSRQHAEMVARHNQEIASPRSDESADVRNARQTAENQDLELRYARGKSAHAQSLPPSER